MSSLFEAVRAVCLPAMWDRGVRFARNAGVVANAVEDDEILLRLTTESGMACPVVTLYPKSEAWECACPSVEDACAHVAAAVIALRCAEEEGRSVLTNAPAMGRLLYQFRRAPGGLRLARVVAAGNEERTVETRLKVFVDNRPGGISLSPTPRDWTIDQLLEAADRGVVPPRILPRLLVALEESSATQLDGNPVRISTAPVGIVGRVVDQNEGVRLFAEQDPAIDEVFANGAALCGDTLRPIREMRLSAREREQLPKGQYFAPGAIAALVSEILPDLEKRIPVEIRTRRLPRTKTVLPRCTASSVRRNAPFTMPSAPRL